MEADVQIEDLSSIEKSADKDSKIEHKIESATEPITESSSQQATDPVQPPTDPEEPPTDQEQPPTDQEQPPTDQVPEGSANQNHQVPEAFTDQEQPPTDQEQPPTEQPPAADSDVQSVPTDESTAAGVAVALEGRPISAVVIGGTGAVGSALVNQLLASQVCNKITVFGRRDIAGSITGTDSESGKDIVARETASGRFIQHITDGQDLSTISDDDIKTKCTGSDVFFCCLGITRSAAGSAAEFHRIEFDIVMKFARQAKAAGVPHFSLVSSTQANPNSVFLFLRTKGEVEQSIQGLEFSYTTIFRPVLLARGGNARFAERLFGLVLKALPVSTLAQSMINDAYQYKKTNSPPHGVNPVILTNTDIYRIASATELEE